MAAPQEGREDVREGKEGDRRRNAHGADVDLDNSASGLRAPILDGMSSDPGADLLPELHVLLAEVDEQGLAAVQNVEALSDGQTVALELVVATREVFRGVRTLLRERLSEEALMLSRTLFEDSVRLEWLAAEPEELEDRALSYLWSSAKYTRELAKAARANGWAWAEELFEQRAREMTAMRKESKSRGLGAKPLDFPRPRELMAEMNDGRMAYWYLRASQSIHSTNIGASARFRPPEGPTQAHTIPMMGPPVEVARVGLLAAHSLTSALIAAFALLPWGGRDELVAFEADLTKRGTELFRRIAGSGVELGPEA